MSTYYSDTHPKMEALQIELLRAAPPGRKMEMLAGLNQAAQNLALAQTSQRHPGASERELHRRLPDLLLGEELARKVYGELGDAE